MDEPGLDLSLPQNSEQVVLERSPCQSRSNLGLYVGLARALSWSILPRGGSCFLQLGHINHVQIIS